jgi:hypothetical protein
LRVQQPRRTRRTREVSMPKSKVRKKTAYTPPADRRTPVKVRAAGPSHPVYKIVMFGLMVIGLAWLVVNYIAGDKIGFMSDLGNWNFAVGFALMISGLLMTMRWR